jgi:phosphoribosylformylglycinamidine synthase subunit PurQ / glutaminase
MKKIKPKIKKIVNVLYSPGTNCEDETMEAIRLAGGKPKLIFLWDIYNGKIKISDCDLLVVPGGFSFGDHLETGVAVAQLLEEPFQQLKESGIPTIGICNGDQILVCVGLFGPGIAMVQNKSKVFRSIPVRHKVLRSNCVWTKGLEGQIFTFPAAHGFGRFEASVPLNVVMEYEGQSPNGSRVAMITDDSGRIAAIMDHPERTPITHEGIKIFQCGLAAV